MVEIFYCAIITIILGSLVILIINELMSLQFVKSVLKSNNIPISLLNVDMLILILSLMAYLATKLIGKTIFYYSSQKIGANNIKR
jgi:ABC-type Mn2+/Zn2+ transport system permease subunit